MYATPDCKVHRWAELLHRLRFVLLDSELTEELKWGVPCYTYDGKNVILLGALKNNCVVSFLKGSLLNDSKKILKKPGENTQLGRVMRFTSIAEVDKLELILRSYIKEAIEIEKSGAKVPKDNTPLQLPPEFLQVLKEQPALKKAFEKLTPGRQREYQIFFSGAKQSATRMSRIEKFREKILMGKGMRE